MATRTCPWCAEEIAAEARKCRYCGSSQGATPAGEWHRGWPERRIAGVAAAVAHGLGASLTVVRAVFLLLAFFHGLGLALYGILWLLLPPQAGGESALDRVARAGSVLLGSSSASRSHPPAGEAEGQEDRGPGWNPTRS